MDPDDPLAAARPAALNPRPDGQRRTRDLEMAFSRPTERRTRTRARRRFTVPIALPILAVALLLVLAAVVGGLGRSPGRTELLVPQTPAPQATLKPGEVLNKKVTLENAPFGMTLDLGRIPGLEPRDPPFWRTWRMRTDETVVWWSAIYSGPRRPGKSTRSAGINVYVGARSMRNVEIQHNEKLTEYVSMPSGEARFGGPHKNSGFTKLVWQPTPGLIIYVMSTTLNRAQLIRVALSVRLQ